MNPQEPYFKWKQKQGLPLSGFDVTDGNTVQHQPLLPAEEAVRVATSIYFLFQNKVNKT